MLKGTFRRRGKRRLSKALVIFQFALSTMLIVGTMLLSRQVEFLRGKDLGFDAEQVVAIPTQTDHGTALMERFRQALATRREVVRVTGGSTPMSETQRAVSLRPDPFHRPAGDAGSARNDLARPGARSALYLSLPRRADRAAV